MMRFYLELVPLIDNVEIALQRCDWKRFFIVKWLKKRDGFTLSVRNFLFGLMLHPIG